MREINPGLISCSLSGYGATGPRVQAAGHDANYLAEAGVLHRNGGADPVFFDPPLADVSGSLFGVIAILGALRGLVRRAPHGALQALFPARIDGHPPDSRPAVRTAGQPSRQDIDPWRNS